IRQSREASTAWLAFRALLTRPSDIAQMRVAEILKNAVRMQHPAAREICADLQDALRQLLVAPSTIIEVRLLALVLLNDEPIFEHRTTLLTALAVGGHRL